MENEDKKNLIIFAVIVVALIIAGAVLYFNKTGGSNNNSNNGQTNNTNKDNQINYKNKLLSMIDDYNLYFAVDYPIKKVSEIENQELIQFAIKMYDKQNNSSIYDKPIEDKLLDEIISEYFGNQVKINHEDYRCLTDNDVLFKYENNKYSYNEDHLGHGVSVLSDIKTYYIDDSVNDNEITINTHILYGQFSGFDMPSNYYKSYDDSFNEENEVAKVECEKNDSADLYKCDAVDYESIKEELPVTSFKFIKNGNNYELKSVEIITNSDN